MNAIEPPVELSQPERRDDLDWLRVFAVLLLIYFHTAAIFYQGELGEFYVVNDQPSPVLSLFIEFVYQWHMPLFFFLSGAATHFSLKARTAQKYLVERFQRLCIPFGFGILTIVPPQVYYRLLRQSDYHDSYWQFYPQFFRAFVQQVILNGPTCGLLFIWQPYPRFVYRYLYISDKLNCI
ncbi:MAG: acyltransferase [Leptolyngbyaceae cyanobacterium CRU_2_3]|nr:acyltransferase [Leptolyngbyaceae cyanobacterium CRU_2_3]